MNISALFKGKKKIDKSEEDDEFNKNETKLTVTISGEGEASLEVGARIVIPDEEGPVCFKFLAGIKRLCIRKWRNWFFT